MEIGLAARIFACLGSGPRLRIFRALAECGPLGMGAGDLAKLCEMPANTLSFHLKELSACQLVDSTRAGRSIIYKISVPRTVELMRFLTLDCCFGNPCTDLSQPGARAVLNQIRDMDPAKENVLFFCRGNYARSQMAEALLRQHAGDRFNVYSAGLNPRPIEGMAIEVMQEIGIENSSQESKELGEFMAWTSVATTIFVCRSEEDECPVLYPFSAKQERWQITAPSAGEGEGSGLDNFRRSRDELDVAIRKWIGQKTPEAKECAS